MIPADRLAALCPACRSEVEVCTTEPCAVCDDFAAGCRGAECSAGAPLSILVVTPTPEEARAYSAARIEPTRTEEDPER